MRTPVSTLEFVDSTSLAGALDRLRDDPHLVPLAGATDLYVLLNAGQLPASRFLNLWRLKELRGIETRDGWLRLGALTTYTEILSSHEVGRHLPMLVEAARLIGGVQIQNRGTLGGNLANASPAGDSLPVLAAADAVIVLASSSEERRVAMADFYTGYRQTARRAHELIVAIEIPPIEGRQWFRKVGTRAAQAISKVVVAAVRSPHPRIALGSVAPTVIRATRTEQLLSESGDIHAARMALEQEITPIDDFRSTAQYRRTVAGNLLVRFWHETS